jgi:hypothetical protein
MSSCLKITEEYLTFDEGEAEDLIEQAKSQAGAAYELIGHSTSKKSKKNIEYFLVKIIKEYVKEKDLVSNHEGV